MKLNQSSATAYLIAESAVYLANNEKTESLVQPENLELYKHFADSRTFSQKIGYFAKQTKLFRPFFDWLENSIIPGIQLHYQVRKHRLEEIARDALAENFGQIIVFGAGFDTLALRLHKKFPDVNFIEIDHPATQTAKRNVIEERGLAGDNLHFAALDLTEKTLSEVLSKKDFFQKDAKTLFIAEGLLMYLEPSEVKNLFDFVRENSAENSRFAFTFMERDESGRIRFRNSSKFVDFWLKIKGEPFQWGLEADELTGFLDGKDFSFQSLDFHETFRRKYLSVPEMENLPLAVGESLCVAETKKQVFVNDIHSKLNKTRVSEILRPQSIEEIQTLVKKAKNNKKFIAVAGGFHAMGGQQFLSDGILLDMSWMNRVLNFEPETEFIEVESGIKWNDLIEFTVQNQDGKKRQVGIRQKQTGADRLTIGGAISANIHGRGLQMKPFINDVESLNLINADGEIIHCSRSENAELFRLVIGGYGLFGIVASVKLRLANRQKMRRIVEIEHIENLPTLFRQKIDENYLYGDFQFAVNTDSEDFLKKGVFSCYQAVSDETPLVEKHQLSAVDWKNLLFLAHTDKQLAFELYAAHYLKTDGQIYYSDTHQLAVYLDDYHREIDAKLNSVRAGSEMITEVYVPLENLAAFMKIVRQDFRDNQTDLIYGTIRLIKRDDESFLPWAFADFACVVFNLHVEHAAEKIEKAKADFIKIIDRALNLGGSFYLTYHRWAEKRQILSAYPQMPQFLQSKRKFDENEIFQSDWYRHLKKTFIVN